MASSSHQKFVAACILAAGKGTRMRSRLTKVLHPFMGRPLVHYAVDAAFRAGVGRVVTVVGHQAEEVRRVVREGFPGWDLGFALQREQRGTGHAVSVALSAFAGAEAVLVLYGDTPLLRAATLSQMLSEHRKHGNAMTIATFEASDPAGYGRVQRDEGGAVLGIVEEADATEAQKKITEVNAGMCIIRGDLLEESIRSLKPQNAQGEYYLTDLVKYFATEGKGGVGAYAIEDPIEARGINTREQLTALEDVALARLRTLWMSRGVSMMNPGSVRIEAEVEIGEDTILGPNVQLTGRTRVGHACRIEAGAILDHCEIGDFVHIKPYTVATESRIASRSVVGPFAHLRPGTQLGEQGRIGNFVETKMARIGARSKISHLSYVGDAEIGRRVNIGAGTITCNYDGRNKHTTHIDDDVFIGSDTQLIAPVHIGAKATIGAGTTVVRDVPEGALAISRPDQRHIEGYYQRKRAPKPKASAKAGGDATRKPETGATVRPKVETPAKGQPSPEATAPSDVAPKPDGPTDKD